MPRPIPRELPVMSACFPLRDIRVGPRLHELKLRCYRCNLVGTRETFSVMVATGNQAVETSHTVVIAAMLQAMSIDKWSLLTNAITLLVIAATAVAALIQLRHLRAQNTLNAELAILKDWNDPQFRQWRFYIAGEMQTKIKDPAFLAEYDAPEVDRSRHPELYACDWLEQIGSYLKYGLLDADVLLDVTSTSINRLWNQLAPAIERMRVTRGDSLYENFEYWAAKGRLWAKAHPGGAYPRNMPRMRDLKGVGVGPGTIFRPAIFGDTPE